MAKTAAIVGAGLIGRAWAVVFSRAGWNVRLHDPDPESLARAMAWIPDCLDDLASLGLAQEPAAAAKRVTAHAAPADAIAGARWVQENGPEVLEIKRDLFERLDEVAAPDAILASSTSAIVASRFTDGLRGRARCLVAHPVNPPHLVPVVELCGAPWTSQSTIERSREVMLDIGQVPVIVKREIEGFVLNRLQGALLSEAMRLVGEDVVTPNDLDATIASGLGLRWSFMGPFATIELNAPGGVADYAARYSAFYRRLAADPAPPSAWDADNASRVSAALGEPRNASERNARMRWRDARLAALRAHQRSFARDEGDST
ncbi:MAG TPA: 3-hydroxyacyl-CoA dehydrogenase [Casimicrobiaceae bacterium]|nr:3-hydroxyacyl-CoA dehydrogenase [Casimicrobiaceae bacterium]